MRESEIYRILEKHSSGLNQMIGFNFRLFAQAILDLAIYRETWDEIVYNKKQLIWFIILNIFRPSKAKDYFAELYNAKKVKRLEDEKKNLQEKVAAKEEKSNAKASD